MYKRLTVVCAFVLLFFTACVQNPDEREAPEPPRLLASSVDELRERLPSLQPGDVLLIADGEYADVGRLTFHRSGTPENPIRLRPLNPHQVRFTGELRWKISASYLQFEGFTFDQVHKVPAEKKYDSLISSSFSSRGIEFRGCRFLSCQVQRRENGSSTGNIITLRGDRHRITGCFFYDPFTGILGLNGDEEKMEKREKGSLRIDHNLFRDTSRWREEGQQGEAMFMGRGFSHFRTQPLGAVVEFNVFDRAIGDVHGEVITVKSSHNTFRNNVFANGPGAWFKGGAHLSLRHCDHIVVENNLFAKLGCGIWVTGRHHRIENNLFVDVDFCGLFFPAGNLQDVEDDRAVIMVGGERLDLTESDPYDYIAREYGAVFWAAEACRIQHNTFAGLGGAAIYMRGNKKAKHGFLLPSGNRIEQNVFHTMNHVEPNPFMFIDEPDHNLINQNVFLLPKERISGPVGTQAQVHRSWQGGTRNLAGILVPDTPEAFGVQKDLDLPPVPPMPGSLRDQPLKARFEPFRSHATLGEPLLLDAAFSAGDIVEFQWEFGDGATAQDAGNAQAHIWRTPGSYPVTLTVRDRSGHTDVYTRTLEVLPQP